MVGIRSQVYAHFSGFGGIHAGLSTKFVWASKSDIVRWGSETRRRRRSGAGGAGGGRVREWRRVVFGRWGKVEVGVDGSGRRHVFGWNVGGFLGRGGFHIDLEGTLSEVIVFAGPVGNDRVRGSRYAAFVRLSNGLCELLQFACGYGEVERQVMDHLALHQVDVAELVETLAYDGPTLSDK
jgi:hypothetical protein